MGTRRFQRNDAMTATMLRDYLAALNALQPFVTAYKKAADDIGDSDLYDEQPRAVYVTLGDCRRAARVLAAVAAQAPKDATPGEGK